MQERLQLPVIRRQRVRYANEQTAEREVIGPVELTVCNRTGLFEAAIEPARQNGLLGVIVLETLDLVPDVQRQKLVPNPESPDMPTALMA